MSVERLKRVLWRVQEWNKQEYFTNTELRRALMLECGTDERTLKTTTKILLELKMIKRLSSQTYKITNDNPQ